MREQLRQLFFIFLEQPGSLADDPAANGSRGRAPSFERVRGSFNSRTCFFARRLANRAKDVVSVRRVNILRGARGGGLNPFAADKIAISVHTSGVNIPCKPLFSEREFHAKAQRGRQGAKALRLCLCLCAFA